MAEEKKGNFIVRIWKEWIRNKGHLKWIYVQAKGFKKYVLGFLAINAISMLVSLFSTIMGKYVVDAATGFNSDFFIKYIIIMLASTLFSIAFSTCSKIFSSYVSEKFSFTVRAKMFDQVQKSIWKDLTKFHSGDVLSRLTSDVGSISGGIISIAPNLIVTALQFVIVFIILLKNDPTLALLGIIIGPLGAAISLVYRKKLIAYQKKLRESESEYYSFFQETLSNFTVVKTFQLEEENNQYFYDIRKKRLKFVLKSSTISSLMSMAMGLVYSAGYVAAFSWCAYRLSNGTLVNGNPYTYGTMTLFLSLVSQVQGSIRSMGGVIPQLFSMLIAAKRIREITDIEDEDYTEKSAFPEKVGLAVDNISFTYDSEVVLKNISFTVKPNQHVGIVGSSGAGKTTLIRLLLSLVKPDTGKLEYSFDDGTAEEICPSSRRFISYVPQGNSLLSGTIRKNLLTGNPDATEEEMWAVLDMVDASDFIRKAPDGLDTVLSEKAGGLSEGQAQRISIARAILRDKPVLILDEATSALDENTERRIFERLTAECTKTCFIITHRRSMLRYCDMVIEISDNGSLTIADGITEK